MGFGWVQVPAHGFRSQSEVNSFIPLTQEFLREVQNHLFLLPLECHKLKPRGRSSKVFVDRSTKWEAMGLSIANIQNLIGISEEVFSPKLNEGKLKLCNISKWVLEYH